MRNCCCLPHAPDFCFRVPDDYLELLSMLPDSNSCASARDVYGDRTSNLLHAVPTKHDPYTPDSMDSPSPNAIAMTLAEAPDSEVDQQNGVSIRSAAHQRVFLTRRLDRAVSPALLKSRLESIVKSTGDDAEDSEDEASKAQANHLSARIQSGCPLSDTPERRRSARKSRSNSDVSWRRSHVLTQAWIHGKAHQGYHSFDDIANKVSENSSPTSTTTTPDGACDRVIPRIAIINASNFESNESSVCLHDERIVATGEDSVQRVRRLTRTPSDEALSLDKPSADEEAEEWLHSERSKETIGAPEDTSPDEKEDATENDILTRISGLETEPVLETPSKLSRIHDSKESYFNANVISDEESKKEFQVDRKTPKTMNRKYGKKVTQAPACNDVEIYRCESKQDTLPSRNTTRSNSMQSQDINDNAGNAKLKLKAYKVTQRYKNNIVGKKGRCQRCCCAIS